MFQLTAKEWDGMWSQIVTSSLNASQFAIGSSKYRRAGFLPYVFTEQGVSMLSSILRSETAVQVSIAIMRAFVFMRQYALTHKDLTEKLKELENKYDKQFANVFDALNFLLKKDRQQAEQQNRKRIGFRRGED